MPRKPGSVWEELPAGAALLEGEAAVLAHLFSVQQRAPLWATGPPSRTPIDGHHRDGRDPLAVCCGLFPPGQKRLT